MLVKISTMYHGKYTSGPVFIVQIVLLEKEKQWNYCCASDSLLVFRLNGSFARKHCGKCTRTAQSS